MNRARRRRLGIAEAMPLIFPPRPVRTLLAHSVALACANWRNADRITPEWWAQALERR